MTADTLDPAEKAHFDSLAEAWWQEGSALDSLRAFNKARVSFILRAAAAGLQLSDDSDLPLNGLSVLDVGCGGGLLSESLARLGAKVTGLDASETAISVAAAHAQDEGLEIDYQVGQVKDLSVPKKGKGYDLVIASEILEHVASRDAFMAAVLRQVGPNGIFVASTLNRTLKAGALGILAAEYVLRIVPRGTHTWRKFIRPSELAESLRANGFVLGGLSGAKYNPLTKLMTLSSQDLSVNYLLWAKRD